MGRWSNNLLTGKQSTNNDSQRTRRWQKKKKEQKIWKKAIICKPPAARRTWPSRACRIDPSMQENKALNLSLSERLTILFFSLSLLQYFLIPLSGLGNTCISFRNPRLSACLFFSFLFFFGHPIILRLFCQVWSITNLTNGISHQPASKRHYSMYLPHGPDETHQLIIDDRVDELKQSRSG